jgi:hypothetical protein
MCDIFSKEIYRLIKITLRVSNLPFISKEFVSNCRSLKNDYWNRSQINASTLDFFDDGHVEISMWKFLITWKNINVCYKIFYP